MHIYWTLEEHNGCALIRSHPTPRGTMTIEGAAQLLSLIEQCSTQKAPPPLVLEITVLHAELTELQEMALGRPIADWAPWVNTISAVENYPNLLVVAIPEQATCGGLEISVAADIRIASATARLGLLEARMGIMPGAGGTQRLPRIVGFGQASALIFSGAVISGEKAEKIGLVEWLSDDPISSGIKFAERCLANSNEVLIAAKKAIRAGRFENSEGYKTEGRGFLSLVALPTATANMSHWISEQEHGVNPALLPIQEFL
jgi:enoyl-CoA hydratase/carnithine racemase